MINQNAAAYCSGFRQTPAVIRNYKRFKSLQWLSQSRDREGDRICDSPWNGFFGESWKKLAESVDVVACCSHLLFILLLQFVFSRLLFDFVRLDSSTSLWRAGAEVLRGLHFRYIDKRRIRHIHIYIYVYIYIYTYTYCSLCEDCFFDESLMDTKIF